MLTEKQKKIQTLLAEAIYSYNSQTVQGIFNNNKDDIQAVLSHKGCAGSDVDTILDYAIGCLSTAIQNHGEIEGSVEIIEQIWQKADQKTRDSVCDRAIESFKSYPEEINPNNIDTCPDLKEVIQKVKEHKKVRDLDYNLKGAIKNLDVEQVREALNGCGEDVKSVLERNVYWKSGGGDAFLVYPLRVKYSKELNQEDVKNIKEIFELMFNAAPPWLLGLELNGNNYVMSELVAAQKCFAKIPGVGEQCFQDLIQKFEEKLSKDTLDNAKTNDTDLGQGNKTPEKNDTTFWSEHKIALSVTGLCVAGAIAAYVLAYPLVALALTVLAAVILMGAGIAKVLENPSVERPVTQREVH